MIESTNSEVIFHKKRVRVIKYYPFVYKNCRNIKTEQIENLLCLHK